MIELATKDKRIASLESQVQAFQDRESQWDEQGAKHEEEKAAMVEEQKASEMLREQLQRMVVQANTLLEQQREHEGTVARIVAMTDKCLQLHVHASPHMQVVVGGVGEVATATSSSSTTTTTTNPTTNNNDHTVTAMATPILNTTTAPAAGVAGTTATATATATAVATAAATLDQLIQQNHHNLQHHSTSLHQMATLEHNMSSLISICHMLSSEQTRALTELLQERSLAMTREKAFMSDCAILHDQLSRQTDVNTSLRQTVLRLEEALNSRDETRQMAAVAMAIASGNKNSNDTPLTAGGGASVDPPTPSVNATQNPLQINTKTNNITKTPISSNNQPPPPPPPFHFSLDSPTGGDEGETAAESDGEEVVTGQQHSVQGLGEKVLSDEDTVAKSQQQQQHLALVAELEHWKHRDAQRQELLATMEQEVQQTSEALVTLQTLLKGTETPCEDRTVTLDTLHTIHNHSSINIINTSL